MCKILTGINGISNPKGVATQIYKQRMPLPQIVGSQYIIKSLRAAGSLPRPEPEGAVGRPGWTLTSKQISSEYSAEPQGNKKK